LKPGFNLEKTKPPLVYILLQIPGVLFLGIILFLAWEQAWISGLTAWTVMLVWLVKDIIFYRFYRKALSPSPQNVIAMLHGSRAVVKVALNPEGQVALRGEIWQAISLDGDILEPGTEVVVESNRGLTLEVRKVKQKKYYQGEYFEKN
jgi:membrane protein implicated in regulation of membrane protease activity